MGRLHSADYIQPTAFSRLHLADDGLVVVSV